MKEIKIESTHQYKRESLLVRPHQRAKVAYQTQRTKLLGVHNLQRLQQARDAVVEKLQGFAVNRRRLLQMR